MSPRPQPAFAPDTKGAILLVDDDCDLLRAYASKLRRAGYAVDTAGDGQEALRRIGESRFDAVVSDVSMPGGDGVELLKKVRAIDGSMPFVLMTGGPTLETAISAVEHHALHYLIKPFSLTALDGLLQESIQLRRLAEVKRQTEAHLRERELRLAAEGLGEALDRALESLWMAYQPIVSCSQRKTIAFEALMRTRAPSLPHPGAVIEAAESLGRLPELGRAVRQRVGAALESSTNGVDLFINLHPLDLLDGQLFDPAAALSRHAHRVVLELTERASLDHVADLEARIARLRQMGFRVAIDDLGAGYAGLTSFVQLKPEVVKLDMSLVRGINLDSVRQKLVASMASLCRDLGAVVLCEGVETEEERDALISIDCDVMQGYLFGKPMAEMVPAAPGPFSGSADRGRLSG